MAKRRRQDVEEIEEVLEDVVEVKTSVLEKLTAQIQLMSQELQETKEVVKENSHLSLEVQRLKQKVENQMKLSSTGFDWKQKGNRLQFEHNLIVVNTVTEAATALEYEDIEGAKKLLKKGIVGLFARNKLIKLVDKSEAGWAFATEYLDSDLADNSEDAKSIRHAEAAAVAKKKQYRSTDSRRSDDRSSRDNRYSPRFRSSDREDYYSSRHSSSNSRDSRRSSDEERSPKLGLCYFCQGDHLRSSCAEYKEHLKKQVSRPSNA
jgi:regulator of replication initiation timing